MLFDAEPRSGSVMPDTTQARVRDGYCPSTIQSRLVLNPGRFPLVWVRAGSLSHAASLFHPTRDSSVSLCS